MRSALTPAQLHDLALGATAATDARPARTPPAKPLSPPKPRHRHQLHPKMKAHAAAVKAAHEHLTAHEPGFRDRPGHEQLRATQRHVRRASSPTRPATRHGWK